jgi:hypothetical protein
MALLSLLALLSALQFRTAHGGDGREAICWGQLAPGVPSKNCAWNAKDACDG